MNRQASCNLMENELKAVQEFLSNYVSAFFPNRIVPSVLEGLVYNAEVLNIESDSRPFTHLTDAAALLEDNVTMKKKVSSSMTNRKKNP